jgi:hypothetical protein
MLRRILVGIVCPIAFGVIACGGGSSSNSSPSTPTAPSTPVQANRAPVINSMDFAPTFGIAQLTQFSFNAAASDPDGDAITYAWDVEGNAFAAPDGAITLPSAVNGTARLTVTDRNGATATDSRTFTVASATGKWTGLWSIWVFTSNLTQNGTAITGDYSDSLGPGHVDSAVANTIDANGNVRMRIKRARLTDVTFTGTIDQTGRRMTGVVNGTGTVDVPFIMIK